MLKHLHWYSWIMAALVLGILICIGLIAYMLFFQQPQAAYHPGAYLVKEAIPHAALI